MMVLNGYAVSEVICINCMRRWTAARLLGTLLRNIECPDCGQTGAVIETGEISTDGLYEAVQEKDDGDGESG